MKVDNLIVVFFFVGFCFVLDFLYEQLQGLSIYQQNHQARIRSIQNISFFKLSVLNLRVHEDMSISLISWRTKHYLKEG